MTVTIIDQQSRSKDVDTRVQNLARELHAFGIRFDTAFSNSPSTLESIILQYSGRRYQNMYIIGQEQTFESVYRIFQNRPIESAIGLISDQTSISSTYAHTTYSSHLGLTLSQRKTIYQTIGILDEIHFRISPIHLRKHHENDPIIVAPQNFQNASSAPSIIVKNGTRDSILKEFTFPISNQIPPDVPYRKIEVAPFVMRLIVGLSGS